MKDEINSLAVEVEGGPLGIHRAGTVLSIDLFIGSQYMNKLIIYIGGEDKIFLFKKNYREGTWAFYHTSNKQIIYYPSKMVSERKPLAKNSNINLKNGFKGKEIPKDYDNYKK